MTGMIKEFYLQFGGNGKPIQTVKAQAAEQSEYYPRNPYATGYGEKIPTHWRIKFLNRWRRVYCRCFSNVGSLWCYVNGEKIRLTECDTYPDKPKTDLFQSASGGFERAEVIKWQWSNTFNRWGAVVRFNDGTELYTWPKHRSAEA